NHPWSQSTTLPLMWPPRWIEQTEQLGTGHAVRIALESPWGKSVVAENLQLIVLPGDTPRIPPQLLSALAVEKTRDVVRVVTTIVPDAHGYGRIVRGGPAKKSILGIVEHKDASPRERKIQEINTSIYRFDSSFLLDSVKKVTTRNAQGEFYLTDVLALARKGKKGVGGLVWERWEDLRGVNDLWELAELRREMRDDLVRAHARAGVRFLDPLTTWIDVGVEIEAGTTVYPSVILEGKTKVGPDCILGAGVQLKDTTVGAGVQVRNGSISESSLIEAGATVGPYAHLRPGSHIGPKAKIGNFVELKKTRIGAETSVAHLSYLGDATVGARANIGCGFVTCNYDGRVINGERKHRTIIEDEVFMGSDCQAIAPITIGKGAYVASGSTLNENVEPGALAIARSRQVNKPGYAARLKPKEKT
ncbi:MAG: bifunctional UDP-N-acetylglucosamine diphosphorylase/glucosamine-1-phosphate N-acetyltransferase GlmU, partial [Bdellovibrionota bacterium]